MSMVYGRPFRFRFPFCAVPALCLALIFLVGCINYFPIHEVWVRIDANQPSQQSIEQIVMEAGMVRSPNMIGDSVTMTLNGKVYFLSAFRWQRDPKVIALVRRSEDGKMIQVRLEDGAKGGWAWRPAVLDLAKKIEGDLSSKFSRERLYTPVDMLQQKVE